MHKKNIKAVLATTLPTEYMIVGETKVEYIIEGDIEFDNVKSDNGLNLTLIEYVTLVTGAIAILKEAYAFVKTVRADLRKKLKPTEVLKELSEASQIKLSEEKKEQLIKEVLALVEAEKSN